MFKQRTALVVDDSLQIQHIVNRILRSDLSFGRVLNAANGKQAMQLFWTDRVDWVISDYEMPEMTGLQLLSAIRGDPRGKRLPFILMTSYSNLDTLTKVMDAGASDFIAKPFNSSTLIGKIRRIASIMENRMSARISLHENIPCRIEFSPAIIYDGSLVNISNSGCLIHTEPFRQGGTVYGKVAITLVLDEIPTTLQASLLRIEAAPAKELGQTMHYALAAFRFAENNAICTNRLHQFVASRMAIM